MALRPRLAPGVPLSWLINGETKNTMRPGSETVKIKPTPGTVADLKPLASFQPELRNVRQSSWGNEVIKMPHLADNATQAQRLVLARLGDLAARG